MTEMHDHNHEPARQHELLAGQGAGLGHEHEASRAHITPRTRLLAIAKAALFGGMAAYLLGLALTGRLANYINIRSAWLEILAGALFFLLAIGALLGLRPPRAAITGQTAHLHPQISLLALALLALPLALGPLV